MHLTDPSTLLHLLLRPFNRSFFPHLHYLCSTLGTKFWSLVGWLQVATQPNKSTGPV
uniref:Uncharacterized protein n=1 Tax=Arundo donax TaxID=35708 RepID=A0A0A9HK54_ARUDO